MPSPVKELVNIIPAVIFSKEISEVSDLVIRWIGLATADPSGHLFYQKGQKPLRLSQVQTEVSWLQYISLLFTYLRS